MEEQSMSTVGNQVGTMGPKEENKEVDAYNLPTAPSTAKKSILFCLPLLLLAWLFSEEYYFAYEQQNLLTLLIKPIIFILIYGLSFRLFFSWIYERVRAKFADSAHFLNYAIIYIPLCLFLLSAASALYKGSSEVFAISPAVEREEMLKAINTELLTYKSKCSTTAAAEHAACVEQYLTDSLLARLMLLEDRAQGFANSYSVIAIMTGFFGVLMTVLIIYFSISGKEAINLKVESFQEDISKIRVDLSKADEHITNKLKESTEEIDQKLEDSSTRIDGHLEASIKAIEQKLEASTEAIEQKLKASNKVIEEKLEASNKVIEEKLEASNKAIEEKLEASNNAIEEKLEASNNAIDDHLKAIGVKIDNEIRAEIEKKDLKLLNVNPPIDGSGTSFNDSGLVVPKVNSDAEPLKQSTVNNLDEVGRRVEHLDKSAMTKETAPPLSKTDPNSEGGNQEDSDGAITGNKSSNQDKD